MTRTMYKYKFLFVPFGLLMAALFTAIVMGLWNAILPDIFDLPEITFWQALGILVLSKILFSGFRWGHSHNHPFREKYKSMTPEEREKFREEWARRCSSWKIGAHRESHHNQQFGKQEDDRQ